MKSIYLNKCQITLKISFENFNVALDKVSVTVLPDVYV